MSATTEPGPAARPLAVLTIGHSTREPGELLALLRDHGVTRLVDVRTVPRSRRNPAYDKESLPGLLETSGIAYEHMPGLGGLRRARPDSIHTGWRNDSFRGYADHMETEEFARALGDLIERASRETLVIMCAEAVPWRCHRSLISDGLTVRGVEVGHVTGRGAPRRHKLTPFARVDGTRITYPAEADA